MPPPTLHGKLTQYRTPAGDARCAFISGTSSDDGGVAVYLGGLTDGPMASPYALELAATLEARGWALCQPVLSSSYLGFGVCSLETDVADLDAIIEQCLPEESDWEERANDAAANDADGATAARRSRLLLVGHSTGCQDIVAYLKSGAHRARVVGAILQAPVSDREAMVMEHGADAMADGVRLAREMIEDGKGEMLMPRHAPGVFRTPITASRYHSLAGRMTPDDVFSSDLSPAELETQLGHMRTANGVRGEDDFGVPLLWAFSGEDEYAPAAVKANYEALASRIAAAAGRGIESNRAVIIPGGGHSLRQPGARKAFIEHVESFFDEWLAFPGVGPAAEFAASSAAALRWGVERLEARMQSELRASELRAQELLEREEREEREKERRDHEASRPQPQPPEEEAAA